MYQPRTKLSKGIKEKLCEIYGDDINVFDEYIPYSIKAAEQTFIRQSLIELINTSNILGISENRKGADAK